jgi:hypothetical protein
MNDHTGIDAPIRRPQTCEQKHDATIADLAARVDALEIVPKFELYGMLEIVDEINNLRERVATLEASARTHDTWINHLIDVVKDLDPRTKVYPPRAHTATPNQAYTWKPGDPWSEYTVAIDGPGYIHSPGYPQEDAEPDVVRVPIAGDVDSDTGAVSWRKGWHASGWTKVTP